MNDIVEILCRKSNNEVFKFEVLIGGKNLAIVDAQKLYNYFRKNNVLSQIAHISDDKKIKSDINKFLKIQKEIDTYRLSIKDFSKKNIDLKKTSLKLWKGLLNNAFEFIGFDEHVGVEKLYEYLSEFRDFEEILYGVNPFYRDHTYHCINLYLMGEYLFRKYDLYKDFYMFTPEDKDKTKAKSAIFCIISLTHDLGYPIESINSINQKFIKMFSHYKNIKLNELSLEFPIAYQGIFTYLTDILSITQTPKKLNGDYIRSSSVKNGKSNHFIELKEPAKIMQHLKPQLSKALIDYNHGILSCFKLIENLHLFKDNYDIDLGNLNSKLDERFLICQLILKTIHYHSTTDVRISEEYLMYFWFNLLDDICEWSRYTRAGSYSNVPGFCNIDIRKFSLDKVEIHFIYENYLEGFNPHNKYETLVKKYYQIIDSNIKTTIKFVVYDKDNDLRYIFKRTTGDKKPNLKINRKKIKSDELLDKIIVKNEFRDWIEEEINKKK